MGAASQRTIGRAGAGSGSPPHSGCCAATPPGLPPPTGLCRKGITRKLALTNLERTFFCNGRTTSLQFNAHFPQQSAPTSSLHACAGLKGRRKGVPSMASRHSCCMKRSRLAADPRILPKNSVEILHICLSLLFRNGSLPLRQKAALDRNFSIRWECQQCCALPHFFWSLAFCKLTYLHACFIILARDLWTLLKLNAYF